MNYSIAITGASGFVGQALSTELAVSGLRVKPLVRSVLKNNISAALVGDIGSETDWSAALDDVNCVIHCAARVHVMRDSAKDPLAAFREANVAGTRQLAEQAAAFGVRRLVFLSSVKVNGERTMPGGAFSYSDMPAPEDAYGVSKWEAEQALWKVSQQTGLEVVIIRSPLVYGPLVKGNFASLVKWIRKGIPLPFGAIENRRSLVALDNLVSFIALCADQEKSPMAANQIFLISDGEDVSTTMLLRKIAQAYRKKPRLLPVPANWMRFGAKLLGKTAVAERLLGSLQVDSSKARDLLGWRPVVTMDEQLRKMAQHDANI